MSRPDEVAKTGEIRLTRRKHEFLVKLAKDRKMSLSKFLDTLTPEQIETINQ